MGILSRVKRFAMRSDISHRKLASFIRQVEVAALPRRMPADANVLAIVVPCYSHDRYLRKAFSSIINQTRKPDLVVFVDDGSPDRTGEVLEDLLRGAGNGPGIDFRIITNAANRGQSESLNRAIGGIEADLIMILNDDDYLMHDAVEVVVGLFRENPDIFLVGSHCIPFGSDAELDGGSKLISSLLPAEGLTLVRHRPEDVARYRGYNDLNMTHSGSCFLKAAWRAVGGYFPDRKKRVVPFSDRDFQLRVNALFPVAVSYEVPFVYWRNNSSVDRERNS